jgi:hypothetical protein
MRLCAPQKIGGALPMMLNTPQPTRGAEVLGNPITQARAFDASAGDKTTPDGGVAMPLRKSGRCRWRRPGFRCKPERLDDADPAGRPGVGKERSKKATSRDRRHRQECAVKLSDTCTLWHVPPQPPGRFVPLQPLATRNPALRLCQRTPGAGAIQVLMRHLQN